MINPMGILVREVLNWKFLEMISRFCATLPAFGCKWVQATHLGRTLTLHFRLSQLWLTNLFGVFFLEQPRLLNAERRQNCFEMQLSLFSLEILFV